MKGKKNMENIKKTLNEKLSKDDNKDFDLLFLVDATGSMQTYITSAKEETKNISKELRNLYPEKNFKYGYIFYRDPIDSPSDIHEVIDLTDNVNSIPDQIGKIKSIGGGDLPEDWAGAYKIVNERISWRQGEKVIIHIADAGAHGKLFTLNDKYPDEERKLIQELEKCALKKINIFGFEIEKDAKNSFNECAKIYRNKGGFFEISDFFLPEKKMFESMNNIFMMYMNNMNRMINMNNMNRMINMNNITNMIYKIKTNNMNNNMKNINNNMKYINNNMNSINNNMKNNNNMNSINKKNSINNMKSIHNINNINNMRYMDNNKMNGRNSMNNRKSIHDMNSINSMRYTDNNNMNRRNSINNIKSIHNMNNINKMRYMDNNNMNNMKRRNSMNNLKNNYNMNSINNMRYMDNNYMNNMNRKNEKE